MLISVSILVWQMDVWYVYGSWYCCILCVCVDEGSLMWRSLLYCFQTEETEEEKKTGTDIGETDKMEVDEEKAAPVPATTPVPADQDSSNSQTQKSESASKGPEDIVPVTENDENAEVSNNGTSISYLICGLGDIS